jgi:hypothetical protein
MPLILPNPPITALLFSNFAADTEQMPENIQWRSSEEFKLHDVNHHPCMQVARNTRIVLEQFINK